MNICTFLLSVAALSTGLVPASRVCAQAPPALPSYERAVMLWIPPYQTARSKLRLREGLAEKAVTHVALQFWVPTAAGEVRRVMKYDKLTDALVAEWRDWCHERGLRALLCLYNGEDRWDWPLAQAAFAKEPEKLVANLILEMELHGLDGIDLDLEGNGNFETDKPAFLALVEKLSGEVHARGKVLTVDTFAYIWNAPNQKWWPELFPLVDGVNSMGYEETGARSNGWRAYSAQVAAAGANVGKLLIGLPTHLDRWQESTLVEHLDWFVANRGPGVALWDAQLKSTLWRTPEPWTRLQKVRGEKEVAKTPPAGE